MSLLFALVIVLPLIAVFADFVTAGELVTRLSRSMPRTRRPLTAVDSVLAAILANKQRDGVDVRLVQEFLGHASITSTAIYTAISPKRLAAVRVR